MRCKQGDLAILLKSVTGRSDGKIVEVKQYIGFFKAEEVFVHNGINCSAPITDNYWWIYCSSGFETPYGSTSIAYSPDTWLKPLPPDLLDDTEETGREVYDSLNVPAEVM